MGYKLEGLLKSDFQHQGNINSFFTGKGFMYYSDINTSIYDNLISLRSSQNRRGEFWEPLNFFNILYEQIDLLIIYHHEPVVVIGHLMSLDLDEVQLCFLFSSLLKFKVFDVVVSEPVDEEGRAVSEHALGVCLDLIEKEYNTLHDLLYPGTPKNVFSFEDVMRLVDTLETLEEKIKYLYDRIDFCQQELARAPESYADDGAIFLKRCELKIKHYKRLQVESNNSDTAQQQEWYSKLMVNLQSDEAMKPISSYQAEASENTLEFSQRQENAVPRLITYKCSMDKVRAYFMQLAGPEFYTSEQVDHFLKANFQGFSKSIQEPDVIALAKRPKLKQGHLRRLMYDFWYYTNPGNGYKQERYVQVLLDNFEEFEATTPETVLKAFGREAPKDYPFSRRILKT